MRATTDFSSNTSNDYSKVLSDISEQDYKNICEYVIDKIGVALGQNKQSLVTARLAKRLRANNLYDYGDYFSKVVGGVLVGEEQIMLDLLTTNETYLFREPAHFNFLRDEILDGWTSPEPFRAWSAACSTGEEAFSLAMTIDDKLKTPGWEVFGSDISNRALKKANTGKISLQRIELTPKAYLQTYCKKGINSEKGTMLISRRLRLQIKFCSANLIHSTENEFGYFDTIFLRNVLIYFEEEMRKRIVENIVESLKEGGYFFISHTESLSELHPQLKIVQPSIYKKVSN